MLFMRANYLAEFTKLALQQAGNHFNFAKTESLLGASLSCNNELLNCVLLCNRFYIYRCKTAKHISKFEARFEIIRNTQ